jgi:hypothetical protein
MLHVILTRQAERAVRRRLFALSFACVSLLFLLVLGISRGLVSPRWAAIGLVTVTAALGIGGLLIPKRTIRKFGASAWPSGMDVDTRRRVVLRIRFLKIAIIFLGLGFILGLVRGGPMLPSLVGAAINLGITATLIRLVVLLQRSLDGGGVVNSGKSHSNGDEPKNDAG